MASWASQPRGRASLPVPDAAGSDVRGSSTDSLRPAQSRTTEHGTRRTLLLIFVHGFQGNEQSFQSFPAHVHNVVTALVAESHVVHTKIYPRYLSKKHITVARDSFSTWLSPHESPKTDVILFGHSMGGLLCADVELKPAQDGRGFQHRLLGTVNFDVPFLGMHPGVIKAGLSSLFQPAPEQPQQVADTGQFYFTTPPQSSSTVDGQADGRPASSQAAALSPAPTPDPNFNPAYDNDVILPVRKGWRNVVHFVNKHSDHLLRGTRQMVAAHVEFGGAMLDYKALKSRYARIRSLAEPYDEVRRSVSGGNFTPARVRFVNYYTASTGRPKPPKSPKPEDSGATTPSTTDPSQSNLAGGSSEAAARLSTERASSSRPSTATSRRSSPAGTPADATSRTEIKAIDAEKSKDDLSRTATTDSAERDVNKTATTASPSGDAQQQLEAGAAPDQPPARPPKDRKFCSLPPKDAQGNRDPAWVRVLMRDVDEVTAHCGLFFTSCPAYAGLVTDVAERVRAWVQDAEGERVARELAALDL